MSCAVQKCLNEATEFLPILGPLCRPHLDELQHTEWIQEPSEESVTGSAGPRILKGDQLRQLNEYLLVEVPTTVSTGSARRIYNPPERNIMYLPLHVRLRGEEHESEITLVIRDEQWQGLSEFFKAMAEEFSPDDENPSVGE